MRTLAALCLLSATPLFGQEQQPASPASQKVVCDEQTPLCTHRLVNGYTYKTIETPQAIITVNLADVGKYTRLDIGVTNTSNSRFDVVPAAFTAAVTAPKPKVLRIVPPEKILSSERHHAGWANAVNAMGAGMASQQVTTQTNNSGTVQATASDGTYANGSYNGTSTSTTSVPDYAARARARENIARRRAALAAREAELQQTALRSNTVEAGAAVGGLVFFESEKHGQNYIVDLPISGVIYEFSFVRTKQ